MMKELKQRTFLLDFMEFKKKLGLPENAQLSTVELSPEGVVINLVGEVQ